MKKATQGPSELKTPMVSQSVYLAGGFHSGWQETVKSAFDDIGAITFLDPSLHKIKEPRDYTPWDLSAISASQIVFGCLEEGNPGGYALSLEIGYAAALKKIILLVDTIPNTDPKHKYLEMVRAVAHHKVSSLDEGVYLLRNLLITSAPWTIKSRALPRCLFWHTSAI